MKVEENKAFFFFALGLLLTLLEVKMEKINEKEKYY